MKETEASTSSTDYVHQTTINVNESPPPSTTISKLTHDDLPPIIRCMILLTRLNKPRTDVLRILFLVFANILTVASAVNFAAQGFSLEFVAVLFWFAVSQWVINVSLYSYFNDQGDSLLRAYSKLPSETQQSSGIPTLFMFVLCVCMSLLLLVTLLVSGQPKTVWFYLWFTFPLTFSIGMVYVALSIFVMNVVSVATKNDIQNLSSTIMSNIDAHNSINSSSSTPASSGDKKAKDLMNTLTVATNRIGASMVHPVKKVGLGLAMFVLNVLAMIVLDIIAKVTNATSNTGNTNGAFANNTFVVASTILLQTIWNFCLYFLLSVTMKPSLAYTRFIDRLKRPSSLLVISECFVGDQRYFFDGLELHREHLVWKVFGISVTLDLYQKIFGSLLSLFVIGGSLVVRYGMPPGGDGASGVVSSSNVTR